MCVNGRDTGVEKGGGNAMWQFGKNFMGKLVKQTEFKNPLLTDLNWVGASR